MNRRKRTQFWGANEDDDSLILEILAGRKTATACQAHEYYVATGEFDDGGMEAGELVDVYDLKGRPRCVIRITEVYLARFGDIPEKLWRAEHHASAAEFQEGHRRAWPHENLTDDFELIATHFELAAGA